MLRFVEKRGIPTDKTKRPERGQKCCQHLDLRFHYLSKCTVNCRDKSEHRGVQAARNGPSLPPCVAKPETSTADRLGSRERAAGATHFAAPMSACTRTTFTRTEQAFGS